MGSIGTEVFAVLFICTDGRPEMIDFDGRALIKQAVVNNNVYIY